MLYRGQIGILANYFDLPLASLSWRFTEIGALLDWHFIELALH